MRYALIVPMLVEVICMLILVFVPFGFDHPSEGELDINYAIYVGFIYIVAFVCGVTMSTTWGPSWTLLVQLLVLVLGVAVFAANWFGLW